MEVDLQGKSCFVYLDAIVIYSDTVKQQNHNIGEREKKTLC